MNYIVRTNLSSYLEDIFVEKEHKLASELGYEYRFSNSPQDISSADILVTSTDSPIVEWARSGLLDKTRVILHPNSGFDNFPLDLREYSDADVYLGLIIRARAVSQTILHFLLDLAGPVPRLDGWDNQRQWNRRLIQDLSLLMVGYGHVGKMTASALSSLGADVHIVDPYQGLTAGLSNEYDGAILACSLNPTTDKLVDRNFLKLIKKNGFLINTARGKCVDWTALEDHMSRNQDFRVALDVFDQEPLSSDRWKSLQGNILTSHVAGVHDGLERSMLDFVRKALEALASSQPVPFPKLSDRLVNGSEVDFPDAWQLGNKPPSRPYYC